MGEFSIRKVGAEGIPSELDEPGLVTLLGDPDKLGVYAGRIFQDTFQGIHLKGTYNHFNFRPNGAYPDLEGYLDANVICPVPRLAGETKEYIVTYSAPEEIGLAVIAVMKEVEKYTLRLYQETLALYALGAKDAYYKVLHDWLAETAGRHNMGIISFRVIAKAKKGSDISNIVAPSSSRFTENEINSVYENLPERYSELYAKRNPEAVNILRSSLGMLDPQNSLLPLLLEMAKKDRNVLQRLYAVQCRIAASYGLRLEKWNVKLRKDFPDSFRYCLYIIDKKERKIPVRFHNRPSYCLYLMYVLDRYQKRGAAADLAFNDNHDEFRRLYHEVLLDDVDKIDKACSTMLRRENRDGSVLRKGRYDDYIKDISDTFDELVRSPDSLVFKVGHGNFLRIPPENIFIDEKMPKFDFV